MISHQRPALVPGSSDEGESTSGTPVGGGTGPVENAEMEENGSIRGGGGGGGGNSTTASNPVYRDLKALHATSAHDVPQDYNPQSRPAYQRGYSPAMDKQPSYEKDQHRPPSSRDDEKSWDYSDKNDRKEYSRSRDSYRDSFRE